MRYVLSLPMPSETERSRSGLIGFRPLRWLRARLLQKLDVARAPHSTLVGYPPSVGRGFALRCAHRSLQQLLAGHEGLRQVLPHLSLLERALARKGSRALQRLPAPVLQRALEQLEDLQSSENHPDLAVLRTRLVEVLALRSVSPRPAGRGAAAAAASPGPRRSISGLDVREASQSVYEEAIRRSTDSRLLVSRH